MPSDGKAAEEAVLTKSLFALHSAVEVESFWKAVQRVFVGSFPACNLGMSLQHNPVRPMIAKWQHAIPAGGFKSEPLEEFLRDHSGSKLIRESEVFPNRADLLKSAFYREYMKPQNCEYAPVFSSGADPASPASSRSCAATNKARYSRAI